MYSKKIETANFIRDVQKNKYGPKIKHDLIIRIRKDLKRHLKGLSERALSEITYESIIFLLFSSKPTVDYDDMTTFPEKTNHKRDYSHINTISCVLETCNFIRKKL